MYMCSIIIAVHAHITHKHVHLDNLYRNRHIILYTLHTCTCVVLFIAVHAHITHKHVHLDNLCRNRHIITISKGKH